MACSLDLCRRSYGDVGRQHFEEMGLETIASAYLICDMNAKRSSGLGDRCGAGRVPDMLVSVHGPILCKSMIVYLHRMTRGLRLYQYIHTYILCSR